MSPFSLLRSLNTHTHTHRGPAGSTPVLSQDEEVQATWPRVPPRSTEAGTLPVQQGKWRLRTRSTLHSCVCQRRWKLHDSSYGLSLHRAVKHLSGERVRFFRGLSVEEVYLEDIQRSSTVQEQYRADCKDVSVSRCIENAGEVLMLLLKQRQTTRKACVVVLLRPHCL